MKEGEKQEWRIRKKEWKNEWMNEKNTQVVERREKSGKEKMY